MRRLYVIYFCIIITYYLYSYGSLACIMSSTVAVMAATAFMMARTATDPLCCCGLDDLTDADSSSSNI